MTINDAENAMIDAAAYGPDDWPDDDDDMTGHDPAAERMARYLDDQDAAADWTPGGDGFNYRATLTDYDRMTVAYARGLCTPGELARWLKGYDYAAAQPGGWKWWLGWTIRRDMAAQEVTQ